MLDRKTAVQAEALGAALVDAATRTVQAASLVLRGAMKRFVAIRHEKPQDGGETR